MVRRFHPDAMAAHALPEPLKQQQHIFMHVLIIGQDAGGIPEEVSGGMLHALLFRTGHGMGPDKRHARLRQRGTHRLVNAAFHGTHVRHQGARPQQGKHSGNEAGHHPHRGSQHNQVRSFHHLFHPGGSSMCGSGGAGIIQRLLPPAPQPHMDMGHLRPHGKRQGAAQKAGAENGYGRKGKLFPGRVAHGFTGGYVSAPEHAACSGAQASSCCGGRIRARGTS